MINYIWLIPVLPALAALINGLFGRYLKKKTSIVAIIAIVLTFFISFGLFIESVRNINDIHSNISSQKYSSYSSDQEDENHPAYSRDINYYKWIETGKLVINIGFHIDNLTIIMLLFISFVGSLVFIYSTGYMVHHGKPDGGYARFFSFLSLFVFFMYILVLANNFVLMFVGWEGVGLCSYLLIGYYMDKKFAADAGKKAFIVNRIGDVGFIIAMFIIFWKIGSLDFNNVFYFAPKVFVYGGAAITAVTLLLFWGACGKSAQIPLYIWLPDAMAGPTPVSALIHAATMVTAGVYMVARCNILFSLAPISMEVVAIVGALTAIIAAFIGITQKDIKKVLAYSTVSQLGFMFLALGTGAFAAGIIHVFNHSFFKGCLFLCAGSVIHALNGEQNMFKMGGLKKLMPITAWTYLISTLAISGIPPFSGFFSKDEILLSAFESGHFGLWLIGLIAAVMTAFYMFRSLFLTFYGELRSSEDIKTKIHESPKNMTIPLIILAVGAAAAGFLNLPEFIAGKTSAAMKLHHYLAPVTDAGKSFIKTSGHLSSNILLPDYFPLILAAVSVVAAAVGLFAAYIIYINAKPEFPAYLAKKIKPVYLFSYNKIFWDDICNWIFAKGIMVFAFIIGVFDKIAIDGILNGTGAFCRWLGFKLKITETSKTQDYALWIVAALVLFIFICLVSAFEMETFNFNR